MTRLHRLMTTSTPWPDGAGLETSRIFQEGLELPFFAAFSLLDSPDGRAALARWFTRIADLAREGGTGLALDTVTWRSNMGWAPALGPTEADIRKANRRAVGFAQDFRSRIETATLPVVINGVVGPSGDGYRIDAAHTVTSAEAIHAPQARPLAQAGVDLVTATTMTDAAEVEATTETSALFCMVNCAHPTHFLQVLDGPMRARIGGIRANASRLSHAELDEATELDDGDPREFGQLYAEFARLLPNLRIIGGCCGSDHRHVAAA